MAQHKIRIRLKAYDHELVDKSAQYRGDGGTHRSQGIRARSSSHREESLLCDSQPVQGQGLAGAFRDQDSQTSDRHPSADSQDGRFCSCAWICPRAWTLRSIVMKTLLGTKVGMTQIFAADGTVVPVTVIQAGPCVVTQKKTVGTDGYDATQIAFGDAEAQEAEQATAGAPEEGRGFAQGSSHEVPGPSDLAVGDGWMSRCSWKVTWSRSPGSARAKGSRVWSSDTASRVDRGAMALTSRRAPGSVGASADPSRVFPGTRLPGQMGNRRTTQRGLEGGRHRRRTPPDTRQRVHPREQGLPGRNQRSAACLPLPKSTRPGPWSVSVS